MKPENAMQLTTDADICASTLVWAQEQIQQKLEPKYKNKLNWNIKVPSQQMSEAVKLGFCLGFGLDISFEYDIDEWSLEGYRYDVVNSKLIYISEVVWSPGA